MEKELLHVVAVFLGLRGVLVDLRRLRLDLESRLCGLDMDLEYRLCRFYMGVQSRLRGLGDRDVPCLHPQVHHSQSPCWQ